MARTKKKDQVLQDVVDTVNQAFVDAGVPTVRGEVAVMDDAMVREAAIKDAEQEKFISRIDKFLDQEFKSKIENGSESEIRDLISKTAILEYENQLNKKNDMDLAAKKAEAKYAGEQYSDATKIHKARIAYAYYILESRGKE